MKPEERMKQNKAKRTRTDKRELATSCIVIFKKLPTIYRGLSLLSRQVSELKAGPWGSCVSDGRRALRSPDHVCMRVCTHVPIHFSPRTDLGRSACGLWPSITQDCSQTRTLVLTPDVLNQNLHFNTISYFTIFANIKSGVPGCRIEVNHPYHDRGR